MPEFGFLSVVEPVFAGIWEFPNGLLRQVSEAAAVEDARLARNESKPETSCAAETSSGSDCVQAGVGGLSAS